MTFSLNEIEATAKRAARGAGYSWGLAEEAAKATRWLCARGIDGTRALAELLPLGLAQTPSTHVPEQLQGTWAGSGALCPLATGALLSDLANQLTGDPVTMQDVATPRFVAALCCKRGPAA